MVYHKSCVFQVSIESHFPEEKCIENILISKNATVITILVAAVVVMTILTIIFARYATVYNDFFLPNNLHNDTDFLTHDLVHR